MLTIEERKALKSREFIANKMLPSEKYKALRKKLEHYQFMLMICEMVLAGLLEFEYKYRAYLPDEGSECGMILLRGNTMNLFVKEDKRDGATNSTTIGAGC